MKTFKEFIKSDHFEEEFSSIQESVTTNNNNKIVIRSDTTHGVMIEKEKGNVTIFVADGNSTAVYSVDSKDVSALKEFFSKV